MLKKIKRYDIIKKNKEGGDKMKKILSVLLVIILLVAALFILTGCGEKVETKAENVDLSSVAGTYKGEYSKFVGDPETAKRTDEPFSLELKSDGTGTHNRDDASFNLTWSLDGENFKMTETFLGASIEYTGSLKDGKLDIFKGDPSNDLTCEYVYTK